MNADEYARMYSVEETHWWYAGLRRQLFRQWRIHMTGRDAPRVLDLGCGTGAVLKRLEKSARAIGLDIAPEALHCCKDRKLERLVRASGNELPFPDSTFDAVIALDVYMHRSMPEKQHAFSEAARVLRRGGFLFINLPAYQFLYSSHDVAIHADKRFTRGEAMDYLEKANCETVYAAYWNTLLFPAGAAIRLSRKRTPQRGSDLEDVPGPFSNRFFDAILRLETLLPRPFGLSILVAGKKRSR